MCSQNWQGCGSIAKRKYTTGKHEKNCLMGTIINTEKTKKAERFKGNINRPFKQKFIYNIDSILTLQWKNILGKNDIFRSAQECSCIQFTILSHSFYYFPAKQLTSLSSVQCSLTPSHWTLKSASFRYVGREDAKKMVVRECNSFW